MPAALIPMAMKLVPQPFDNPDWLYEIKWDGFRMVAFLKEHQATLKSRNNKSLTRRFAQVKEELERFSINAVFDGEVVLLNDAGCADFSGLINSREGCLVYYVFDLPWYDGYDLTGVPLYRRREILKSILPKSNIIRFSDHLEAKGEQLFEHARLLKLAGIVAKHKNSLYYPGERSAHWLKIKTEVVVEATIAGLLLDLDKPGSGFNSLVIGVEEEGGYKYIGLVEAGISKDALVEILSNAKATK
ncbi:MAG: DNA ligase D, partial [Ignavibacteriales bacterium]